MRYFSVCSGIEAASVAWEVLGWQPVGFSEIEPFPCEVLKQRFPTVKNYGDMTKFKEWTDLSKGSFDLLVGGVPCQAFSLAGMRRGLDDPRGNLTLVFLSMVDYFKPKYVVFENVPGIMSDKTHAFEQLLAGLNKIGYIFDADILDAQDFGVPQRRKRVFVVAINADYINSNFNIEVDYEKLSYGKLYTETQLRTDSFNFLEQACNKIEFIRCTSDAYRRGIAKVFSFKKYLQGLAFKKQEEWKATSPSTQESSRSDDPRQSSAVLKLYKTHLQDNRVTECKDSVADTVTQHYGTGGGNLPLITQHQKLFAIAENTLDRRNYGLKCKGYLSNGKMFTLMAGGKTGSAVHAICETTTPVIRRITPIECERLQGFPDNWTRIKWQDKDEEHCPLMYRYKACGNSMAVPVMQYIGKCIDALENALQEYKK